ncbi:hypothetical protein HK097_009940, partial [Rhizophlyctis rosea]
GGYGKRDRGDDRDYNAMKRRRTDDHDSRFDNRGPNRGYGGDRGKSGHKEVVTVEGVEAYFKRSFIEDPWAALEPAEDGKQSAAI